MDYRRANDKILLRLDKGDEILKSVLSVCRKEGIRSALFHGIGACSEAVIATYLPEKDTFLEHGKEGMLEMISLEGNIIHDDENELYPHAHVLFSCLDEAGEIGYFGGHFISGVVWFTAEIVIEPVTGEGIGRMKDPWSEVMVWKLSEGPENAGSPEGGA